ncbi:MAG TPA: patatin-like phospholipase family protein [Steroidobacteraceae bacterium]|nr:patatin-like phospholipase family protein [Steroidobacteraceae bacterium]
MLLLVLTPARAQAPAPDLRPAASAAPSAAAPPTAARLPTAATAPPTAATAPPNAATLPTAATAPSAAARPPAAAAPPAHAGRLRVGLVLSGGGARGAAHIGVLQVLDQLHIPIDAIAGTSMGAVVGGLYASGLSGNEIAQVADSVNWQDAFRDRPPRAELGFRRKEEDQSFLVNFPLGIRGGRLQLPKGLIQGQTLEMMLRRLTMPVAATKDFDRLPTPFRAVATDLATGEPVVMGDGDLATAMRASLSAPGVFVPVERDNKVLVDGGLADNLPVDVARTMGVDVLIVVDVGAPLFGRERLGSATAISNQMLTILIRRDMQRQLASLTAGDIVISPDMGNASSFDFGIVPRAVAAGAAAARALAPRLRALAVSPGEYARYVAAREAARSGVPRIEFVRVAPGSERFAAAINSLFGRFVGEPFDQKAVDQAVTDLYGRGDLQTLDYKVVQDGDRQGLEVSAERNSYGPNYVRFGLSLQDDFKGNAVYNAGARFVMSELTATGGEWVADLQTGYSPHIYTELYLPFEQTSPWFVDPHTEFDDIDLPLDDAHQNQLAVYRVHTFLSGIDFGREFENVGEVRAGIYHEQGGQTVLTGAPAPDTYFNGNGYFTRFTFDQLDDVRFPHDGVLAGLEWNSEKYEVGQEQPFDRLTANFIGVHSFGRQTLMFWASGGATFNQTNPDDLRTQYPLGGLFNLSGLPQNSVEGPQYAIVRGLFYRKIGRGGDGPFDFPTYVGISLEAGNVWQKLSGIDWGSARKDASIFLGIDTLLGPVYIATGYEQHGRQTFYLFLGRTFQQAEVQGAVPP